MHVAPDEADVVLGFDAENMSDYNFFSECGPKTKPPDGGTGKFLKMPDVGSAANNHTRLLHRRHPR
jgi:hypothetical protein